ncbi:MAG: hypothetical protein HGB10_01295 [Coriobacteriia bacterium]|nr:hypothetical protein [Coriobacteriia bacterium]
MSDYTSEDAREDLALLRAEHNPEAAQRIAAHLESVQARLEAAERVCVAAAEIAAPTVKRDVMQHRMTRFLRTLAEWREEQGEREQKG